MHEIHKFILALNSTCFQCAKLASRIILPPMVCLDLPYFPACPINSAIFGGGGGGIENIECVLIYSTIFVSNISYRSSRKMPAIIVRF